MKNAKRKALMKVVDGTGQARRTVAGLSEILHKLLVMADRPILLRNMENYQMATVSPYLAAHPRGFLPLMVLAGNSVWASLGEEPYHVCIQDCPSSPSAFELVSVTSPHENIDSLDALILAMMEAISQATDENGFTINGLGRWITFGPPPDLVEPELAAVQAAPQKRKKRPEKSR